MARPRVRSYSLVVSLVSVVTVLAVPVLISGEAQETQARPVYVTVLDAEQAPVTGLTAADIVIMEDGTARQVSAVTPATEPLAIVLLVDTAQPRMGSNAPTRDLRAGLAAFLKIVQAANAESQIAVMQTGGAAVMSQNFTSQTADLTRAFNRLVPSARSSAVVLEALVDAGRVFAKQPSGRRVILSIDFDSQETSGVRPNDVAEAVQDAGAAVWAISVRGSGGSAGREAVLDAVTEITGGLRLTSVAASALESQLQTVANALTSQYLVTYQRPGGATVTQVRAAATKGATFLVTRPAK